MKLPFISRLLLASACLIAGAAPAASPRVTALEELRAERAKLAAKPRRLIANNDGCDCLYFPGSREPTVQNFLGLRTTPLVGSHVGAISYCSISSGFGHFSHNTRVGTVFTRQGKDYGIHPEARNITDDLIRQGTDTLKAVTEFAHANGMESFWSLRMNDTHDVVHRPDKPYFLFPRLKVDHPEWLVGDHVKRTPQGRWSSVDYARPEIRELAFRYAEEVCRNYDVDGIELDFLRHLCYFKNVANGGRASDAEVAAMTGLMRRIRTMTEAVGLQRGRPILVSMRTPDSADFSRECGLDLAAWLKEGLMDILITTDYFRLNPWENSVKLGHAHGVKVYPTLTDPRVKGETRFKRISEASYRGRAANAWAAGADGLYIFNLYDLEGTTPLWKELGDPGKLAFTDKLYFVAELDGKRSSWLAGGDKYFNIPMLTPTNPAQVSTKQAYTTQITIADDVVAAASAGYKAKAMLHLEVPGARANRLKIWFNGEVVSPQYANVGWLDAPLKPQQLKKGVNAIRMELLPAALGVKKDWMYELAYDGKDFPMKPWTRDVASPRILESMVHGGMLLQDLGTESGDYCYYRAPWNADPDEQNVASVRVKVIDGLNSIILANGRSGERLRLTSEGISLHHNRKFQFAMDTTDNFHLYHLVQKGTSLRVMVDGHLRIDAPLALQPRSGYESNEFAFGAASSSETGKAIWKEVKILAPRTTQELRDAVVSISYEKEKK